MRQTGRILLLLAVCAFAAPSSFAALPDCHCYFNKDCQTSKKGDICNYTGNLTEETVCQWKKPKFGNQTTEIPVCSQDDGNKGDPGAGADCDGLCKKKEAGSNCGDENPGGLRNAASFWAEAMIDASENGGGQMIPALVQQALDGIERPDCRDTLGRHVGSLLVGLYGYDYFEHPVEIHEFEGHGVADLSTQPCLVEAGRVIAAALDAELATPGSGAALIDTLPQLCPEVLDRAVPCPGLDNLTCIRDSVTNTAELLRTPLSILAVPTLSRSSIVCLIIVMLIAGTRALRAVRS